MLDSKAATAPGRNGVGALFHCSPDPERHKEADLQSALLRNLRKFLMELGGGFAFIGEEIRVQMGNQDFELNLLFYHRDLQCLVVAPSCCSISFPGATGC